MILIVSRTGGVGTSLAGWHQSRHADNLGNNVLLELRPDLKCLALVVCMLPINTTKKSCRTTGDRGG